jgi:S-adenosyl-L-methionine hydrolase (adenosine-forming)
MPNLPNIVTLTTDFGGDGPYVAAMKGVILREAPGVQLVDVSHVISPQAIREGAFVIGSAWPWFPKGTVHLGVVDPGVGTERRLVAASVAGHWFVAPDNGLIGLVTRGRTLDGAWAIAWPDDRPVSRTFHGRDLLAPAAAHIARGGDPADLGPPCDNLVPIDWPDPVDLGSEILGEIVFRDNYGNLVTNVPAAQLIGPGWGLEIAGQVIPSLVGTYGDRPAGTLVALVGSFGLVEVAEVNGDASRRLEAGPGTAVTFRRETSQ